MDDHDQLINKLDLLAFQGNKTGTTVLHFIVHRQETIPLRNAIDAHAQHFMVMTVCYYPLWNQLHIALVHYMLLAMLDVFSLCAVEMFVVSINSSSVFPPVANNSPHRARHTHPTPPTGNHLVSCGLYGPYQNFSVWRELSAAKAYYIPSSFT